MRSQSRIIPLFALALVMLLLAGCGSQATPAPTSTPSSDALAPSYTSYTTGGGRISALGTVRPAQTLQLSFLASGPVQAVTVQLGTEVKEGDLLATLDTAILELELQSAQEEVALRQAQLESLLNGPAAVLIERAERENTQQVAQAEIALQLKRLQLEQAGLEDPSADVAAAQTGIEQLQLQLAQMQAESPQADVAIARSAVDSAQAQLDQLLANPDEQIVEIAQANWELAKTRLWQAQLERDAIAGRSGVPDYQKELAKAEVGAAETLALIAQLEYQLAGKGATEEAIRIAQAAVQQAEAQRDRALGAQESRTIGQEILKVQVSEAQDRLAQAVTAQEAYTVTLDMLAAEVESARLALEALQAWENPYLDPAPAEEIAQAKARLRQAELLVAQLELQLQGAELRAPFDGTISAVYLHPSEWAAPGVPAVEIVDTAHWRVETRNVSELAIGQVQVGQGAIVRVNAFRDQELPGQVVTISPVAIVQQGDTTYTLAIELEPTDLNLRPGMTAQVEILEE
jgi:HlyD family secretion protein